MVALFFILASVFALAALLFLIVSFSMIGQEGAGVVFTGFIFFLVFAGLAFLFVWLGLRRIKKNKAIAAVKKTAPPVPSSPSAVSGPVAVTTPAPQPILTQPAPQAVLSFVPVLSSAKPRVPASLGNIPLHSIRFSAPSYPIRRSAAGLSFRTDLLPLPLDRSKYGNFCVIDVETTGLSAEKDEIIEITALRFENYNPVRLFTTLIRPNQRIPSAATKVNYITNEDVADAPFMDFVVHDLQNFIAKSDLIVGHNVPFDMRFLYQAGLRFSVTQPCYDTMRLAKQYAPKSWSIDSFTLGNSCEAYGCPFEDAHFSAADCLATGRLFTAIIDNIVLRQPETHIPIRSVTPSGAVDKASPLYKKRIAFTGKLTIPRRDAMQKAVDAGMTVTNTVNASTDFLVLGYIDTELMNLAGTSSKLESALSLTKNNEGHIQIIGEKEFLEIVSK